MTENLSATDGNSHEQLLRKTFREAAITAILTMRQIQQELPLLIKKPRQMSLLMNRNNALLHLINALSGQLRDQEKNIN